MSAVFIDFVKKFVNPRSRLDASDFLWRWAVLIALGSAVVGPYITGMEDYSTLSVPSLVIGIALAIALAVIQLWLVVVRLHAMSHSAWLCVIWLIPILNIIFWLTLLSDKTDILEGVSARP